MRYMKLLKILLSLCLTSVMLVAGPGSSVLARSAGNWPDVDSIQASAFLVADLEGGDIILDYQADDIIYPASTTKMMTALLMIESDRLDETVIVSEFATDLDYDMAKVGFLPGEEVVLSDVLYSLMLSSGNDAARVAAEALGGSIPGFADMMTQRARQIGMQDTIFKNPSGLHDPDHITTASDMLLLAQYAMKNEVFRDIVMTDRYVMPNTNLHPFDAWAVLQNSNQLLRFGDLAYQSDYYQSYSGIKTGTTRAAGFCLVASAKTYDDREISVLLFGVPYYLPRATLYQYAYTLFQEAAERLSLPAEQDVNDPEDRNNGDDTDQNQNETVNGEPVEDDTTTEDDQHDDSGSMTETTVDPDQKDNRQDPADNTGEAEKNSSWKIVFFVFAIIFVISLGLAAGKIIRSKL